MSTQLILYPQNYNGQYNSITNPTAAFTNFISNGQLFIGLGSTTLYSTNSIKPPLDAILNEHPTIINTWYRFTTIVGAPGNWGAVTAPAVALNSLVLSVNDITEGHTGVYQQLTGLTVGATYVVKITITTGQPGAINLATYLPNTGVEQATSQFSSNTTSISWNFHATSTNQILSVDYIGGTANLLIESIAVLSLTTTPSGVFTDLIDGQVICDLYQEEDIPLTLSIDDFKNVAEQVKSYSKDFNLPATKRNNRIFNNMFEVTRADDGLIFNPYVKTKCVLKQDGFILFEGYLRLIDIKDKEGEISYNVNLYSEVIALADVLKDATFSDLDFSELEHDYNKTSIKESWEDVGAGQGLPLLNPLPITSFAYDAVTGVNNTQVLKYPFIDWTHQYIISQNTGVSGPTFGNPELTTLQQAFKPCIQLKYLIEKIFAASGFSYTSDFFNTTVAGGGAFDFDKLYMDFNWGATEEFPATGEAQWDGQSTVMCTAAWKNYEFTSNTFSSDLGWDAANNRFEATYDNTQYNVASGVVFVNDPGEAIYFRWVRLDSGGTVLNTYQTQTWSATGSASTITYSTGGPFIAILDTGDTLQLQARTPVTGVFKQVEIISGVGGSCVASIGGYAITTDVLLQTLRGELGQWDFLKGIMTMFNLVTMVDENNPNNILIEPYSDVFINNTNGGVGNLTLADRGIQHDWTDKVDVSEMELNPLTDLNKSTIFKFVEDDDDYCFNVYKDATSGHLYGSKEIDASGFTILQGIKEIIAEPFAATVSKPIDPEFPSFIIPSAYALSDDGTSEGFDNSPRIFYNNGVKDTGASYYMPEFAGLSSENQIEFLQFSHLTHLPPGAISSTRSDFVFESHQLFSLGGPPTNNLYNIYWSPYFNELYNADTRTMTLKVNLSPSDVASFRFYDVCFIKNRVFRVNKIEYKPNDLATVEFILIP
jgi:hypothetical protein